MEGGLGLEFRGYSTELIRKSRGVFSSFGRVVVGVGDWFFSE